MELSIIESTINKSGSISIKPYFDDSIQNLGLEKYNMSLFDGVFHEEQLACLEVNGMKRYITGLNEFAPDIKKIKDKDAKEARIKEIRVIVSQLERDLGSNIVEPEDPEFWSKVKLIKPDNDELWKRITLRCGNSPVFLDPAADPYDLIKICAIEAGGFSIVAKSYEDARTRSVPPKFYLDRYVETVTTKTEVKKIKNKALSTLQNLYDKNTNKLFYVAKVVDGNSVQYKKNTPNDILYENLDVFINGKSFEKNIRRASELFLSVSELTMDILKIRALIKDATFYKIIAAKSDGFIYHVDSSTMMGRNPHECLEFLNNPLNDSILLDITKKIESYWNK